MESSRRAVESYWRSRMIDGATSDEDKVTPVYKLEEICDLLRSSHVSIVKEVCDFILKRLDHKSPIVKQKALRLIKYSAGKSGSEVRREMQRHSVAVRQLVHYRGHPDPLKGDALNKAVRETAQEVLAAIFAEEDSKPSPAENLNKRIQGFGNTNFDMQYEEKKSFLTEVVELGSASIKQGLSTLSQSHSMKRIEGGSYRGPTLRRSLTNEIDHGDIYPNERTNYTGTSQSTGISDNTSAKASTRASTMTNVEPSHGEYNSSHVDNKTREDRLVETIVTVGGLRLQPTRDALQAFLGAAAKQDALALSRALHSKLQSTLWQVRMKALCVLEAILRKKYDEQFAVVASYFSENVTAVARCSESPQASLREKSNKVLSLLGVNHTGADQRDSERALNSKTTKIVEMPDLIDTGRSTDLLGEDGPSTSQIEQDMAKLSVSDIWGHSVDATPSTSSQDGDPFADVSFHATQDRAEGADLFAGMTVGDNSCADAIRVGRSGGSDAFDFFGSSSELPPQRDCNDVGHLMSGLTTNGNDSKMTLKEDSAGVLLSALDVSKSTSNCQALDNWTHGGMNPQAVPMTSTLMSPMVPNPYGLPHGIMFNQTFPAPQINYATMSGLLSQQQLMAAVGNLEQLGKMKQKDTGSGHFYGGDEQSSVLPDIFNANIQNGSMKMANSSKDTKAFDFISDHLGRTRERSR